MLLIRAGPAKQLRISSHATTHQGVELSRKMYICVVNNSNRRTDSRRASRLIGRMSNLHLFMYFTMLEGCEFLPPDRFWNRFLFCVLVFRFFCIPGLVLYVCTQAIHELRSGVGLARASDLCVGLAHSIIVDLVREKQSLPRHIRMNLDLRHSAVKKLYNSGDWGEVAWFRKF